MGEKREKVYVWTLCPNMEGKKGCWIMKSIYEEHGGIYLLREDGMYYPELAVWERKYEIGKYGNLRREYLKTFHHGWYANLLLSGELHKHLQEVEEECFGRMESMIEVMKKRDGVTEELKTENQMLWVRKMNGIVEMAEEIVLREVAYG